MLGVEVGGFVLRVVCGWWLLVGVSGGLWKILKSGICYFGYV